MTLVPAPRPRPAPCSPGGAPNRRRAAARESALRARARGARGRHREPHPSTQLGSGRRAAAPPARPFLTRCYRSLEGAVERQPSTGGWRDGEISPRCTGRNPKPKPRTDPEASASGDQSSGLRLLQPREQSCRHVLQLDVMLCMPAHATRALHTWQVSTDSHGWLQMGCMVARACGVRLGSLWSSMENPQ